MTCYVRTPGAYNRKNTMEIRVGVPTAALKYRPSSHSLSLKIIQLNSDSSELIPFLYVETESIISERRYTSANLFQRSISANMISSSFRCEMMDTHLAYYRLCSK